MSDEDWPRLAELLIARRIQLGHRNRAAFARHLGLTHDRTLSDIENARRSNYEPSTIVFIEHAYQWEPGSVRAVLGGGEPRELQSSDAAAREARRRALERDDSIIDEIWDSELPIKDKLESIQEVLNERTEADRRARERFAERLRSQREEIG